MTVTVAPIPALINAALVPATPPPSTTTSAGGTPGTPPSSTPRPPFSFSRQRAPTCGAMRPGDLRHRREQRERALGARHRLVGNRDDPRGHQFGGLFRIGGQMQIGEEDLSLPELLALDRQRFLDLHDQLAAPEHLIGIRDDFRPDRAVVGIRNAGAQPGAPFNDDVVTVPGQLAHRRRHEAHTIFAVLDFLRHADEHGHDPECHPPCAPDTRIPAGTFYVPDSIIATAEHSIILIRAAVLDFRHRVAFLTPRSEPDRSAT